MGQKLAAYNSSGAIVAFYDTVDSPAPSTATTIEITDAQWQAAYSSQPPYTVVNGALVAPSSSQLLMQAQGVQNGILNAACAQAIQSGFTSSALGSANTYPSDPNSQQNQATIAASASGGSLWCENSGGTWGLVAHTQTQAQAVATSFASWLNACQQQLVTLSAKVGAATSIAAAQAISWTNPPA